MVIAALLGLLSFSAMAQEAKPPPEKACHVRWVDLVAAHPGTLIEKLTVAEVMTLIHRFGAVPIEAWDDVFMVSDDGRSEIDFVRDGCLVLYSETISTRLLYGYIGRLKV